MWCSRQFADPAGGGFFYTASDHEQLLTRTKELTDSSVPSGNALAATALLRLGKLLGRTRISTRRQQRSAAAVPIMQRAPMAAGQMLLALDRYLGPSHELVLVGDGRDEYAAALLRRLSAVFAADVLAQGSGNGDGDRRVERAFLGKASANGEPVLYVCENFACQEPAVGEAAIDAALDAIGGARPTRDGSAI